MKLTATRVKAEARPGRYNDGSGLYLLVRPNGRKSWVFRYRLGARQRDMGLGSWPETSLAEARQEAQAARKRTRAGDDPIDTRKAELAAKARKRTEAQDRTFKAIAEAYIKLHESSWKNAKHRWQWRSTLESYAYPKIGGMDVADIDRAAVLDVLRPIWAETPENANRLRGRIETVLDYAASQQLRSGDNPAIWRTLRHSLPAPKKVKPVEHQAALPWRQAPVFMADLRTRRATAARALDLVILTVTRTNEALGCRWPEFDLDNAIWTIRSQRMKGGKVHRVALSPAAVTLLRELKAQTADTNGYVFPGQRPGKPLSQMSMAMLLRRMQGDDEEAPPRWLDAEGREITVHGFRSSFRDWAADVSGHPREVIEAALAHVVKSKAEAAYARSDLLERRRPLMAAWAAFLDGTAAVGEVVDLATRRSA
jgi:integrase